MIEGLPVYVPVVFILTTLFTVGVFVYAIFRADPSSISAKILLSFIFLWLIVQAVFAVNGFFQNFSVFPPRTFALGPLPFFIITIIYLVFFRRFLAKLPLTTLTWIHVI